MCTCSEKTTFFEQKRLNHGVGGGITLKRVYPARAYTTLVVLVKVKRQHPSDINAFLGREKPYKKIEKYPS